MKHTSSPDQMMLPFTPGKGQSGFIETEFDDGAAGEMEAYYDWQTRQEEEREEQEEAERIAREEEQEQREWEEYQEEERIALKEAEQAERDMNQYELSSKVR